MSCHRALTFFYVPLKMPNHFCFAAAVLTSRVHTGAELLRVDSQGGDAVLKQLWNHSDAIMCCSLKTNVTFHYFSTLFTEHELFKSGFC